MNVVVDVGGVSRKDGDWLRDRNELSRPRLGGCLCHNGQSIVAVERLQKEERWKSFQEVEMNKAAGARPT